MSGTNNLLVTVVFLACLAGLAVLGLIALIRARHRRQHAYFKHGFVRLPATDQPVARAVYPAEPPTASAPAAPRSTTDSTTA
jgi:hypothetical protein